MKQIKLIIVDFDQEYLFRFLKYIRESEYHARFALKIFTELDLLHEYLTSLNEPAVLFYSEECEELANLENNLITKIMISSNQATDDATNQGSILYRYQPLNLIISLIYTLYLENNPSYSEKQNQHKTKIIAIAAAYNNYPKNQFSLLLAKYLASRQHKVFYLDLEVVSSQDYFLCKPQDYDLSKIIYHLKKQPEKVPVYIEKYRREAASWRFDYFERTLHISDLLELNEQDTFNLITAYKNLGIYDYLVVLLESAVDEMSQVVFAEADHRIMLVESNLYSQTRILRIKEHLAKSTGNRQIKLDYILSKDTKSALQSVVDTETLAFVGFVESAECFEEIDLIDLEKYFAGLNFYLNRLEKE